MGMPCSDKIKVVANLERRSVGGPGIEGLNVVSPTRPEILRPALSPRERLVPPQYRGAHATGVGSPRSTVLSIPSRLILLSVDAFQRPWPEPSNSL